MRRVATVTSILVVWWVSGLCNVRDSAAASEGTTATNLLPNASFEEGKPDLPATWRTQTWGGRGAFAVSDVKRSGAKSVSISSEQGADAGWHVTVPVLPHAKYRLSGWIKTENVRPPADSRAAGRGALLNLHNIQPTATQAIAGTRDWTKVELEFESESHDAVQINCLFGGWGLMTGRAWYDDLTLELLASESWKPSIAIDAAKEGHPISKYIYGQFIEHLGRCIYGGIWAEMLEDRKFYFPIVADYAPYGDQRSPFPVVKASPWQILGPGDAVTMVTEEPFVGGHTPRIAAGGGIQQNDLALVAGKEYEGTIWLRALADNAAVTVRLEGAEGEAAFAPAATYQKHAFRFRAVKTTDTSTLAVQVEGGACLVGTVSLMPTDNVHGMRADTLALLKELNSPIYRWPGGNFVSGYDWKDGIGDRDRRPPRKNPAWTGVEHNDFGLDEFMTFCDLIKTEPYVVVNSGQGGVPSAVEQLQYANGGAETPMGAWRARNGHPEPYKVQWWGVGNEMYGNWQLGHMPLAEYIRKHKQFAQAMRAEDPSIRIIAVGDAGRWSEGMMQECAEDMDLISEHFYCQSQPGLSSHVKQMTDAVRQKAEAHRDYRRRFGVLEGKDIDIALDEWNYWYGPHVFGELGTRYFLKDGLGVAAALHECARQSDIMFMANYAQTVNVIGCIKTSKTAACLETTGLALKLYTEHFGTIPVAVETQSPLDVAAALTADRRKLTLAVVNPTMQALDLPLTVAGVKLAGRGTRWQIAGSDPMAHNDPGNPANVRIETSEVKEIKDRITVAACSVTLFELEL